MNEKEVRDPEEDVSLDTEVEAKRAPGSAVVAVRIPSELLRAIDAYAGAHQLTVSEVVRQGVEQFVGARVFSATGTRIFSSMVFYGATTGGQLRSTEGLDQSPELEKYTVSVAG